MRRRALVFAVALAAAVRAASAAAGARVLFARPWLNYTFATSEESTDYVTSGHYKNTMLAGIKQSRDGSLYVSVPRWMPGVPSTLNKLVPPPGSPPGQAPDPGSWLLQPFPSWHENSISTAEGLKSVLGFEIDACDRLWALDQGKMAGAAANAGDIKLVAYDLGDGGKEIMRYVFPPEIASLTQSFLNDLVVDHVNNFIYITDSGIEVGSGSTGTHGALIAFDIGQQTAKRVLYGELIPSVQANPLFHLTIQGRRVHLDRPMLTGADGIALSPDASRLHFCPLTSRGLFSIETSMLRDWALPVDQVAARVESEIDDKLFASDGLAISDTGRLFLTSLEYSALLEATQVPEESTGPPSQAPSASAAGVGLMAAAPDQRYSGPMTTHHVDTAAFVWPDTIGFDNIGGGLLVTSNKLYRFIDGELDPAEVNFRVVSLPMAGVKSYTTPHATSCAARVATSTQDRDGSQGPKDGKSRPTWHWVVIGLLGAIGLVLLVLAARYCIQRRRDSRFVEDDILVAFEEDFAHGADAFTDASGQFRKLSDGEYAS